MDSMDDCRGDRVDGVWCDVQCDGCHGRTVER